MRNIQYTCTPTLLARRRATSPRSPSSAPRPGQPLQQSLLFPLLLINQIKQLPLPLPCPGQFPLQVRQPGDLHIPLLHPGAQITHIILEPIHITCRRCPAEGTLQPGDRRRQLLDPDIYVGFGNLDKSVSDALMRDKCIYCG